MTDRALTQAQIDTLSRIAAGRLSVWVIVYPDGDYCVMRDGVRAAQHEADSHGQVVEYQAVAWPMPSR
jgi:hypothetical protein